MNDRSEIQADPVLTFDFIIADLGVSKPTFFRHVRPKLEVVQISPGRLGVLSSFYRGFKASLRRQPPRAA